MCLPIMILGKLDKKSCFELSPLAPSAPIRPTCPIRPRMQFVDRLKGALAEERTASRERCEAILRELKAEHLQGFLHTVLAICFEAHGELEKDCAYLVEEGTSLDDEAFMGKLEVLNRRYDRAHEERRERVADMVFKLRREDRKIARKLGQIITNTPPLHFTPGQGSVVLTSAKHPGDLTALLR